MNKSQSNKNYKLKRVLVSTAIAASLTLAAPVQAAAQNNDKVITNSYRREARGLLGRLEKYGEKYLSEEKIEFSKKPQTNNTEINDIGSINNKKAINVYENQQDHLVQEIIALKQKLRTVKADIKESKAKDSEARKNANSKLLESKKLLENERRLDSKLENELNKNKRENEKLIERAAKVELKLANKEQKLSSLMEKDQTLTASLKETSNKYKATIEQLEAAKGKIATLEGSIAQSKEQIGVLQEIKTSQKEKIVSAMEKTKEFESLQEKITQEQKKSSEYLDQIASLKKENAKIEELKKKLIAAQNAVLMQNTELEVLGKGPNASQRAKRKRMSELKNVQSPDPKAQQMKDLFQNAQKALQSSGASPIPVASADVLVVEVKGQKVNLRVGAGKEHSPVMQVAKGTRLTVESRQGEWLRVFTPTGGRAYVREDLVTTVSQPQAQQQTQQQAAPGQPVVRTPVAQNAALVPFGKVKVAGNPQRDLEDAALSALKSMGKQPELGLGRK